MNIQIKPDSIDFPLAYKPNNSIENLREKARNRANSLSNDIFKIISKENLYYQLKNKYGNVCAELLVKKSLFQTLNLFCRDYERRLVLKEKGNVLWKAPIKVNDPYLIPYLKIVLKDDNLNYHQSPFSTELKSNLKNIVFSLIRSLKVTLSILSLKNTSTNYNNRIAIQANEGVPASFKRSELNWYDREIIPPSKICLMLFNGDKSDLQSKEEVETLQTYTNNGMVILTNNKRIVRKYKCNHLLLPAVIKLPSVKKNSRSVWLKRQLTSWDFVFWFWKILFSKFQIKVWQISAEHELEGIIQMAAIESLGGICISRQRSCSFWGLGYGSAHLSLTWHKKIEDELNYFGCMLEKTIPIGHSYLLKKDEVLNNKLSHEIRSSVENNKTKFVIALFDNLANNDMDFTEQMMFDFVNGICEFALTNPSISIILKTKSTDNIDQLIAPLLYDKLKSEGRIKIIAKNFLPHIVSKAADLSIGSGISSAVWEGAARGLRTFHFHATCPENHFLYKNFHNHILFTSFEKMKDAIHEVLSNPGQSKLGLAGKDLQQFDHYHDGLSNERTVRIMRLALESDLNQRKAFYENVEKLV